MAFAAHDYTQTEHFDRVAVERVWQALVDGRPVDPSCVSPYVLDSWRRCLALGIDPHTKTPRHIGRGATLGALLSDNAPLLRATRHTWDLIAETLIESESILVVTDRHGVEIETYGKPVLLQRAGGECVAAGYDWSEASAGTNAVATTLALNHPTIVRSAEHFCTRAKIWDCAAAPVRDLNDGTLLGVLDVTSLGDLSDNHTLALAVTAAHQVEHTLHSFDLARSVQLLNWYRNKGPNWHAFAALLLDRNGRVITATERCRAARASLPAVLPMVDGLPRLVPGDPMQVREYVRYAAAPSEQPAPERSWAGGVLILEAAPHDRLRKTAVWRTRVDETAIDPAFAPILGANPGLIGSVQRAGRMARAAAPVLLTGETGSGKELFARAIHASSAVAGGPFVAVNCGALTKDLALSELFGYEAGAFTGASSKGRRGKFEEADGGSLFLDEIGELPPDIQVQLLRVLQDGVVVRVGGNRERAVSVRVVAATHRDLEQEAEAGRFRPDLYYRLKVLSLKVPPLRERPADIALLVTAFLREMQDIYGLGSKTVSADLLDLMTSYAWPGNVRELRGLIESMYILSIRPVLSVADLPEDFARGPLTGRDPGLVGTASVTLDELERDAIVRELDRCDNHLTVAAKRLGISRSTLYRKLERYAIEHR